MSPDIIFLKLKTLIVMYFERERKKRGADRQEGEFQAGSTQSTKSQTCG